MTKEEAIKKIVKEYGQEEWEWIQIRVKNSPEEEMAHQYEIIMDMYPAITTNILIAIFGKTKNRVRKRKESDKRACERDMKDTEDKIRIKELMDKKVPKYLMTKQLGISDYRVKKLCKEINPHYKPNYSVKNREFFTEEELERRRRQSAEYYIKLKRKRLQI